MNPFRKTFSLLLALSLLQFFAPTAREATAASCCALKAETLPSADCCEKERPPAQMQCCPGKAQPDMESALPAAKAAEKVLRLQLEPSAIFTLVSWAEFVVCEFVSISSFNPHFNSNQLYLLTATLLI